MIRRLSLILLLNFLPTYEAAAQEVVSENGMISCAHPLAAEAGIKIMQHGGNAIDAAVAAAFVLSVVEPYASGIGGGGFLIVKAKDELPITIDYREKAPININPNEYYQDSTSFKKLTQSGSRSIGVPGVLAGMDLVLKKYGSMNLGEVLQPAIEIAESGYPVSKTMGELIFEKYDLISNFDKLSKTFLVDGFPPDEGSIITNTELAETYQRIGKNGIKEFYEGEIAFDIVNEINTHDSTFDLQDLKNFKAIFKNPIIGYYRGYKIISTAPPSGGGTHLIELLNIMENYDIEKMNHNFFEHLHILTEAIKIIQNDKITYMADPDYVRVPIDKLISKNYAESISKLINLEKAETITPEFLNSNESGSTTHISAVDNYGNIIAITQSINLFFGSGLVAGNTGILLNNHLGNFDDTAGLANSIAPGKKPVSSIAPTLILKDGKPFLIFGTPGGSRIIGTMAQVIINMIDFKMNLTDAIESAKIHFEKSTLHLEKRIEQSEIEKLKIAGHKVELHSEFDKYFGGVNAIMITDDGNFIGASDSRRGGTSLGY
jgi:gamma-glutamyltranspeptidase / glutathione hydrolase